MRKVYAILVIIMLICIGCQWQLKPNSDAAGKRQVSIQRYDRIESLYLTTGDYSALQQMNTNYPTQTRMLIEDMLQLGPVNAPGINTRFLHFFQDSTLQNMLYDVQQQYADLDDLNEEFTQAFEKLALLLPSVTVPEIYTQIGSFDQSIIVGNNMLGISLDKYLGRDYPFYQSHYTDEQRRLMVRSMIVPDAIAFYLLSLFPLPSARQVPANRVRHMGRIQWVVQQAVGRNVYDNAEVAAVEQLMKGNDSTDVEQLLRWGDLP
ncbi:MAG: gliding motility protein GldB [Prevotella sp.]|nr:gliding motility protein GldB [Prevotella sp.]